MLHKIFVVSLSVALVLANASSSHTIRKTCLLKAKNIRSTCLAIIPPGFEVRIIAKQGYFSKAEYKSPSTRKTFDGYIITQDVTP